MTRNIEAHFECICGTKFTAPKEVNPHHDRHMLINSQFKNGIAKPIDSDNIQTAEEIDICCPNCGHEIYQVRK